MSERSPAPGPPRAMPPPRRLWPRRLAALLALALLASAALLTVAWQALHTESATQWWLEQASAHVPGLTIEAPRGALLGAGAQFSLARLSVQLPRYRVVVDELSIAGLQLVDWRFTAPFVHVQARSIAAARLAVSATEPREPTPAAAPPTALRVPLTARIDDLAIARLQLPGLAAPIDDVQARVELGASHRVEALSLRWRGLRLEGRAQLEATAPLTLQARVRLSGVALTDDALLPDWARDVALDAQAAGPLAGFGVNAALTMQAQRLDATARVTPFAALPVSQLDARFSAIDLARLLAPFSATAPTTELSGSVAIQLDGEQPLIVQVKATNTLPGRWDQHRLPLAAIDLHATGRGAAWQIERARLQLAGDVRSAAGTVDASGRIDGPSGTLRVTLGDVLLDRLDQRAPPLRLSGPIEVKHDAPTGNATDAPFGTIDYSARLDGALTGAARQRAPRPLRDAVQLTLRGSATPTQLVLEAFNARAGSARLDAKGRARHVTGQAPHWDTQAELVLGAFDPAQWLPGEPMAAWRRSRNALNGTAALRAQIPEGAADAATFLGALRGTLAVNLADSVLAGQPLALSLDAAADGAGQLSASGRATAADNNAQLALQVRLPARAGRARLSTAADEQVRLQLDAPALARLAPLADALGLGPIAGRAQLDARADGAVGAWLFGGSARGALTSRGTVKLAVLQLGSTRLDAADAQWDATLPGSDGSDGGHGTAARALARAVVQGRLDLTLLRLPGLAVPSASLQAEGTLAEHRVTLHAALRQPQSAGAESSARAATVGTTEPAPLTLDAALRGAWQAGTAGAPNRWTVDLGELALRPSTAAASAKTAAAARTAEPAPVLPLIVARDARVVLQHDAQSLRVSADPGSADVLGALLRWSTLRWERESERPPRLELQAEVEPFRVAQLLQRLQPEFGWSGDLRVGAKVDVRSDPQVTARVEIARTGGDLQVTEFGSRQALGLSEVRLALSADAGEWRFTELIVGSNLGRVSGQQTVRTAADRLWPAPDAALAGELNVQVENLAAWGAWVPAGWRLGGQLDASLRLAGRFGSPELVGQVQGRQLALRNTLEGVTLTEGELDARFDGTSARLATLRFRAGEGEVRLSGDARLGAEPQAQLTVTAERATLLGRVDRRVVASGQARVRLDAETLAVDGKLRVDEGLVDISRGDAPSLGDDVTVRRIGDKPLDDADAPAAPREARAIDMKLSVDLGPRFRLRGRGIDTRLEGELRLATPSGKLTAHGEIRAERGTYEAYGQKLDISRGVITFVGDIANPRLDIEAVRANTDTRVGVIVGGNTVAPRVRLFSDPELPPTEKLALLVTGRSYDSLGGSETLLLQRAALALLAGEGADESNSNFDVARLLQLDELSVRQSDGAVRETVVALGKQISERVYLGYERGLNATAGNWQLIYRIAQRFTLRAQSGEDPAVDLIWIFRWN